MTNVTCAFRDYANAPKKMARGWVKNNIFYRIRPVAVYFHGQVTMTPKSRMWLLFLFCLTPMVEALQKIGNIYQPARRNIPEDLYVQQHSCEKLKSYIIYLSQIMALQ
jgi:hypothetical protein